MRAESKPVRINDIINTGIFECKNAVNPLYLSAFTEVLIHLRDLVAKCGKYANRLKFSDDVIISDSVKDITDLICYIRNAVCELARELGVSEGSIRYRHKHALCVLKNILENS